MQFEPVLDWGKGNEEWPKTSDGGAEEQNQIIGRNPLSQAASNSKSFYSFDNEAG